MFIVKKQFLLLFLILNVSCTGSFDPWGNDPWGNNGQGQDWNQNVDPPADNGPTSSGVNMDDEADSEDNVSNTQFDGTISIAFSEEDAVVSGSVEGVNIQKDGTRVTATNTGDKKVKYILSGNCSDGCFKLYSSKKQAIELNGLTLTNTKGAAINNQSKKRTFIIIEGANTLSDGSVNTSGDYLEETSDEDMKATIFSEGQLAFSGSGTLTVNAVGKAGITSDDYVRFMAGSDVTVNSSKGHGVRGKDAIIVSGGSVKVTLETGATGKKCFTTDSLMYIGGGSAILVNKASAGIVDSELTGAAGIKADQLFVICGGELSITASGKGCKCISGDGDGFFEGGKVVAKATGSNYGSSNRYYSDSDNSVSSKALKFDGKLEFSGSQVSASASSHEAIEAKNTIYISGGSISAISSDDAINSASTMTISDGVVYAYSTGNDGLDANGNLVIKGGTVYAIGCGNPEVGLDANTEGGYRLFITGGNVIAIGGLENSSSVSQAVISTSWSRNASYSLCDGETVLFSFKAPSSGGTGLYMTAPSLVSGSSYSLKSSATVNGATSYFDEVLSIGGTATGGSSTSVTASIYSSGGNIPGGNPGGGPGGNPGGGPGGRGW